ncbi:alpha/beta fold hydrolase [Nocardia miyunensis]|uniref:alpha/beta fold hydrolase n=1 Tax=Nocardia miyunensis TaxID=282684 RepID=UPI00082EF3D8|nr:alpha/beta hydrolase [Nocardia miyunensis]
MISRAQRRQLLDRVDVVDSGTGPVVALAHGAGGGVRENFTPLIDTIADRRFVGPYYPGAGGTPRATEPLSIDRLADTVVAAAAEAGAERFPIVGLSLGSAVAVTAAIRHPEHVSALVLTVGLVYPDAQARALVRVWRQLAERGDFDTLAELLCYASSPGTLASLSEDEHAAAVRQIRADHPIGSADHVELVSRTDIRPLLAAVDVPTLVIVSGEDRVVLPDTVRELASGIAGAELVEYPSAGHIFTPAEAGPWAAEVSAFLDRLPR